MAESCHSICPAGAHDWWARRYTIRWRGGVYSRPSNIPVATRRQRMAQDAMGAALSGPAAIFQMLNAAQVTAVLGSAIELDVFSQLDSGASTAEAVADRVSCPVRGIRILLD